MAKKTKSRSKSAQKSKPKPKPKSARAPRYVYYFGDGKADGAGGMKPLLGWQRRQPCRDDADRFAGPARIHDHDRSLHLFFRKQAHLPSRTRGAGRGRARQGGEIGRQETRRQRAAAARFSPLRRARLHARDDGHHPQPRDERRPWSRSSRRSRTTRASPGIHIAVFCKCTAMS